MLALAKEALLLVWETVVYVIVLALLPLVLAAAVLLGVADWVRAKFNR